MDNAWLDFWYWVYTRPGEAALACLGLLVVIGVIEAVVWKIQSR